MTSFSDRFPSRRLSAIKPAKPMEGSVDKTA